MFTFAIYKHLLICAYFTLCHAFNKHLCKRGKEDYINKKDFLIPSPNPPPHPPLKPPKTPHILTNKDELIKIHQKTKDKRICWPPIFNL